MPPRLIVYGTEGIGKSTFASEAPAPIFVQTEDGLAEIECDKFPLATTFEEVQAALSELYSEQHDFQTVVIDSFDWLEGRRFRRDVIAILAAMGVQPLAGRLFVRVDVYPPDRRRRDLDNVQKALFDALEHGGAYGDDSQIVKIALEKHEPTDGGKTNVLIRQL